MCQHQTVTQAHEATEDSAAPREAAVERHKRRSVLFALGALALVALSALAGMAWGQRHPVVHEDEATCLALETQIGCTLADGWDIAVSTDLPWTDSAGVFQEGGRPACLPVNGRGASQPVELHWIETSSGNRYVVEVACKG